MATDVWIKSWAQSVRFITSVREVSGSNLSRASPTVLTEVFRGFRQFLQLNNTMHRLGQYRTHTRTRTRTRTRARARTHTHTHTRARERPPLWSSGQSSWLQIQRSGLDSRRYQIFWEVVGLERGPLSLVSTIEELLERESSCSGLETREYGSKDPSSWPRGTLSPQQLALISPTNGGRAIGIVHSRTEATEL
jgi:hypothetical protein